MSKGKVVLGALAGVALGAIAGILFAPEKGSKTRRKILDKRNGYVDEIKTKFDKLHDSITNKFESVKEGAEDTVSAGKAKYDDVKRDVRNAASNIKQATS